jgi:uncharacterized radical SAM superfamily Fe-S cluster-containing enzyme
MPGFELYLQFDSLREAPLRALRGADLRDVRQRALATLNALNLSTTLVVTVRRGLNDEELGEILEFAVQQRCVRGVTFQPVQDAGRNEGFDAELHRLTLTEVRRKILAQTTLFRPEDLIPVPCNPDCLAMAYGVKTPEGLVPLSGLIDKDTLIEHSRNTIVFESDQKLRAEVIAAFSTGNSPEAAAGALSRLLCCLPAVKSSEPLRYDSVFRVILMQFLDRHSLDMRTVRRSCVHIAHPDGRRVIPFDTYNLFYRDALERETLTPLRRAVRPSRVAHYP